MPPAPPTATTWIELRPLGTANVSCVPVLAYVQLAVVPDCKNLPWPHGDAASAVGAPLSSAAANTASAASVGFAKRRRMCR
jgi:hypothetical protein